MFPRTTGKKYMMNTFEASAISRPQGPTKPGTEPDYNDRIQKNIVQNIDFAKLSHCDKNSTSWSMSLNLPVWFLYISEVNINCQTIEIGYVSMT